MVYEPESVDESGICGICVELFFSDINKITVITIVVSDTNITIIEERIKTKFDVISHFFTVTNN